MMKYMQQLEMLVLGVALDSCRFSSPKFICFEGKINEYLNQSNFSHFLLLFFISLAIGQFHGRTWCLSRRSIFGPTHFWISSQLEKCVRKCMLHRSKEMVIRWWQAHEYARCGRTFHSNCKSVCFTLFATCGRAL